MIVEVAQRAERIFELISLFSGGTQQSPAAGAASSQRHHYFPRVIGNRWR